MTEWSLRKHHAFRARYLKAGRVAALVTLGSESRCSRYHLPAFSARCATTSPCRENARQWSHVRCRRYAISRRRAYSRWKCRRGRIRTRPLRRGSFDGDTLANDSRRDRIEDGWYNGDVRGRRWRRHDTVALFDPRLRGKAIFHRLGFPRASH